MKKKLFLLSLISFSICCVGCSNEFEETDQTLDLESSQDLVTSLDGWPLSSAEELLAVQSIDDADEAGDYITLISEVLDEDEDLVGYEVTFAASGTVLVANEVDEDSLFVEDGVVIGDDTITITLANGATYKFDYVEAFTVEGLIPSSSGVYSIEPSSSVVVTLPLSVDLISKIEATLETYDASAATKAATVVVQDLTVITGNQCTFILSGTPGETVALDIVVTDVDGFEKTSNSILFKFENSVTLSSVDAGTLATQLKGMTDDELAAITELVLPSGAQLNADDLVVLEKLVGLVSLDLSETEFINEYGGALVTFSSTLFSDMIDLTELQLPTNIDHIYASSLTNCSSLLSFTVTSNIASVGESAFNENTQVYFEDLDAITYFGKNLAAKLLLDDLHYDLLTACKESLVSVEFTDAAEFTAIGQMENAEAFMEYLEIVYEEYNSKLTLESLMSLMSNYDISDLLSTKAIDVSSYIDTAISYIMGDDFDFASLTDDEIDAYVDSVYEKLSNTAIIKNFISDETKDTIESAIESLRESAQEDAVEDALLGENAEIWDAILNGGDDTATILFTLIQNDVITYDELEAIINVIPSWMYSDEEKTALLTEVNTLIAEAAALEAIIDEIKSLLGDNELTDALFENYDTDQIVYIYTMLKTYLSGMDSSELSSELAAVVESLLGSSFDQVTSALEELKSAIQAIKDAIELASKIQEIIVKVESFVGDSLTSDWYLALNQLSASDVDSMLNAVNASIVLIDKDELDSDDLTVLSAVINSVMTQVYTENVEAAKTLLYQFAAMYIGDYEDLMSDEEGEALIQAYIKAQLEKYAGVDADNFNDYLKELYDIVNNSDLDLADLVANYTPSAFAGFEDYTKLESVENLPSTLTFIGESAFRNTALKSIVIPENVTIICKDAFYGCSNLELVVCQAVTAPFMVPEIELEEADLSSLGLESGLVPIYVDTTVFDGIPSTAVLQVPESALANYEAYDVTISYTDILDAMLDDSQFVDIIKALGLESFFSETITVDTQWSSVFSTIESIE